MLLILLLLRVLYRDGLLTVRMFQTSDIRRHDYVADGSVQTLDVGCVGEDAVDYLSCR